MGAWDIHERMFLSMDEVNRLLRHIRTIESSAPPSDRPAAATDRMIVETLLFSGLRTSEFCRLRLADTSVATGRPALEVRSRAGGRTVWLPAGIDRLLRDYVRRIRPALLAPEVSADDSAQPLVLNERRRPYDRTALYRRVVRVLALAGLGERASVQLLRHTYGYLAYKGSGGNLRFVQRQLGHAHPIITSVYAQFVQESYEEIADRVAAGIVALDTAKAPRAEKRPRRADKRRSMRPPARGSREPGGH